MFQEKVYKKQALGSAGDVANNLGGLNTIPGVVADANVCAGCFVKWKSSATNENEVFGASGVVFTSASEKILGVCLKSNFIDSTSPNAIYPIGQNVVVATAGNVLIETETACKRGQYVFIQDSDGALVFGDSITQASCTYTGWRVSIGTGTNVDTDIGHDVIEITTALF